VRTFHLVASAFAASVFAGCTALPSTPVPGPESAPEVELEPPIKTETPRPGSEVESLLRYFEQLRKLSSAQLGKEHDSVRQAYAKDHSEFNRVRLAMVLSLPNTSFGDESRALELLDPTVKNQQTSLSGLALLLAVHVQERRKLAGNVQVLQQSVQGLQQKLDALKSLERSLIEREQGGPKKR
jgi:hypothetical protein